MCHLCNTIHIARLCFDVMMFTLVMAQWALVMTVKYLPFLEDNALFFRVGYFEANFGISIMYSTSLARKMCTTITAVITNAPHCVQCTYKSSSCPCIRILL